LRSDAVRAVELGRKYEEIWGLKNSTFTVKSGEIAVLVGPNGAGKTTTVKVLTTILKPSKGKAEVLGMDIVKDFKKIRKRIAYLPQGCRIDLNLTPLETIKWSLVARGLSFAEANLQSKKWIELMGLSNCKDRTGWTLSGGEIRRVCVAMALATEAELIFLDEPTAGLDVEARHKTWKILREAIKEGVTILLTTHDMTEAETIADTAILINEGNTLVQETPQKLVKSLPYQYKIIVRKDEFKALSSPDIIDLGDRLILYAKDSKAVETLLSQLNDLTNVLAINRTGLEDAYLRLIHGIKP